MRSFFGRKGPSQPNRIEVETEVSSITMVRDPATEEPFAAVFLKEKNGEREFPIVIGLGEARAIAMQLEGIVPPRPLTHDLFANNLAAWNIAVQKVVITKLEKWEDGGQGVFHAQITQSWREGVKNIDSRPSDAIALALRFGAPIYATDDVLNECYRPENKSQKEIDEILARIKPLIDDTPGQ